MIDHDDQDAIALDFAARRLSQLAERVVDPHRVWDEVWSWIVAAVIAGVDVLANFDAVMLAAVRLVTMDLIACL